MKSLGRPSIWHRATSVVLSDLAARVTVCVAVARHPDVEDERRRGAAGPIAVQLHDCAAAAGHGIAEADLDDGRGGEIIRGLRGELPAGVPDAAHQRSAS